jgi:hypothetical protein
MPTRHRLADLLLLLLFALPLCLVGCATPAPLVRLYPRNPNAVWVSGRAVVAHEQAGIRVATAFDEQHQDTLGLRIEIQNLTNDRLEIAPEDVTYLTCTSERDASCSSLRPIINPEEVLMSLDVQSSRERANATNEQGFLTPLLLLSVVSDVAAVGSGRANASTGAGSTAIANDMENAAARHGRALSQMEAAHAQWSTAAFRRTTLFPGQGAAGYVYLPIETKARYVWLQVHAGGQRIPFGFTQVVTPVMSYANRPGALSE